MRQLPFIWTLVGASLLACGLLGVDAARTARDAQAADVKRDVQRSVAAFDAYFERARSMDLLLAQNPLFADFYTKHGADRELLRRDPGMVRDLDDALAYLEVIYPTRIGEACFIDQQGREMARVVRGSAAAYDDLSVNERGNSFFAATMAQPVGVVYQAAPYRSADTGDLVISNSTRIEPTPGRSALVHFEVTLASFLDYLPAEDQDVTALVIDRRTGRAVLSVGGHRRSASPGPVPAEFRPALVSKTATGQFSVDGRPAAYREIAPSAGNANRWVVVEVPLSSRGPFPLWAAAAAAAAGALLLLLALAVLLRQQRALRAAARLDHLTGLSNRLAAEEVLTANISGDGAAGECGVLVLDLDGFKQINDTLGHHRGDDVLREIARRLHANTFEYDLACRLGGDEFAVVLSNLTQAEDIMAVADRLHQAMTRPIEVGGVQRFVGASIGAAVFPDHGRTAEELFRSADSAMYSAKRDRSPPRLYTAGTPRGADDLTLAAELLEAIERGQIVLHYQPQFDLRDGALLGVEALARWDHPERGLRPPAEFIGLAERTGLIRPLTLCTLRLALDQARVWMAHGTPIRVSVNLSPRLLVEDGLDQAVLDLLDEYTVPPQLLALEITETAAISGDGTAQQTLHRLRDAGVRIELDDFGSGYSSLHTLSELPVGTVKLDRSLLTGLGSSAGGEDSLRCLIEFITRLGHLVVAEGIETQEQADMLRRAGCTAGQGFLLGKPLPAGEAVPATAAQARAASVGPS